MPPEFEQLGEDGSTLSEKWHRYDLSHTGEVPRPINTAPDRRTLLQVTLSLQAEPPKVVWHWFCFLHCEVFCIADDLS